MSGYALTVDEKNYDYSNPGFAVDQSTGESLETVLMEVPIGSRVYTPKQQQEYTKRKEQEEIRRRSVSNNKALGKFVFLRNIHYPDLSPETLTRLVYLNSFVGFTENLLINDEGKLIQRKDLPHILNVSKAVASVFFNEVCPKYLHQRDDGALVSSSDHFVRGKLKQVPNSYYRKVYIKGIRKLYRETPPTRHKHLGYLFALLPYINIEYNLLCRNPAETEIELIQPITLREFCDILGFDFSNVSRLRQIYRELRFKVGNDWQRFCTFVNDGVDIGKSLVFINPRILYSGSDFAKVEVLTHGFQ